MHSFTRTATVMILALLVLMAIDHTCHAQSLNPIQLENQHPGTSDWRLSNVANDHEIEGYASLSSVTAGQRLSIFVNTADRTYSLTIYRMGYYGGLGGRQMTKPVTRPGIAQPIPTPDPTTGLVECQWKKPYVLKIPRSWLSGFYVAKLVALESQKERYIIFVVRNDQRPAALLFQSATATYQRLSVEAEGGRPVLIDDEAERAVCSCLYRILPTMPAEYSQLIWQIDLLGQPRKRVARTLGISANNLGVSTRKRWGRRSSWQRLVLI